MNAPDPAFRKTVMQDADSSGIDLVIIARGGATALLTTLFKLEELQSLIPHHLTDYRPYYLADSAGAYAVYGLVAPSLADPTRPCMTTSEIFADFLKSSASYLSPDREVARQALISHAGRPRIKDTLTPVTFSTVDITNSWERDYFTHFPHTYMADHPHFVRPTNRNNNTYMDDAVLASSAHAILLGEHRIEASVEEQLAPRRTMDMAFTEFHARNLLQYSKNHDKAFPPELGRRVVCVILGNNFINFKSDPNQNLLPGRMNKAMPDVVRYLAHCDLVNYSEALFGEDNVFDLSLMVPQDVAKKNEHRLPPAFRGDADAILRRYDWTKRMLDQDEAGHARIRDLARIIREEGKPVPGAPRLERTGHEQLMIDQKIAALRAATAAKSPMRSLGTDFAANVGPVVGTMIAKPAAVALTPVAQGVGSVLRFSWNKGLVPAAKGIATELAHAWATNAPKLQRQWDRTLDFLMTGTHAPKVDATPPLLTHSSEQSMPSESGYTPL